MLRTNDSRQLQRTCLLQSLNSMARGQLYLAVQIISKYGKRQVVTVERYTERSFSFHKWS